MPPGNRGPAGAVSTARPGGGGRRIRFLRLRIEAFPGISSLTPDRKHTCLLYTSDAADDLLCVDLGGRRIIKKKKKKTKKNTTHNKTDKKDKQNKKKKH